MLGAGESAPAESFVGSGGAGGVLDGAQECREGLLEAPGRLEFPGEGEDALACAPVAGPAGDPVQESHAHLILDSFGGARP